MRYDLGLATMTPNFILLFGAILSAAACAGGSPCPLPDTSAAGTGPSTDVRSAVTSMPEELSVINPNVVLTHWGNPMDTAMVTLGPTDGVNQEQGTYAGKTGTDVVFDSRGEAVLAPLDMRFIGFSNRSAEARDGHAPYDDLELCFESEDPSWAGMKFASTISGTLLCCEAMLQLRPRVAWLPNGVIGLRRRESSSSKEGT